MSPYTRLERAVMDALSYDLRAEVPDLARQFGNSRPSQRRNSAFGLFTEMIVDRGHSNAASGPTGDFGTVHAMVGPLRDPIAFKVRVRDGVLLGLFGDSYGQDTRSIDFSTVAFDQVFTVNEDGRSVPFEPARQTSSAPPRDPHRHSAPRSALRPAEPPSVRVEAPRRVQPVDAPASRPTAAPNATLPESAREVRIPTDQASLLIGLWTLIAVIALLLVFVFRLPVALGVFFAILAGRAVKQPAVIAAVRKALDNWQTSRVIGSD